VRGGSQERGKTRREETGGCLPATAGQPEAAADGGRGRGTGDGGLGVAVEVASPSIYRFVVPCCKLFLGLAFLWYTFSLNSFLFLFDLVWFC
jgi:hypothetical protein